MLVFQIMKRWVVQFEDVKKFGGIVGDFNPVHSDP